MNLGSDPADQIVRYNLRGHGSRLKALRAGGEELRPVRLRRAEGPEKDQGKTRLVRMLKEQRPFKFFKNPQESLREFAKEARAHGLLYVPIRNKQDDGQIELVVFADDAAKVQRVLDNLNLDFVKAQAGEATVEQAVPQPIRTERVQKHAI